MNIDVDDIPSLPKDNDGPVFAEPWHAQVFALAVSLCESHIITWEEWSQALGEQIHADSPERRSGDACSQYYEDWLRALEGILEKKGLTTNEAISQYQSAWHDAYLSTPHGQPVELS